MSKKPELSFVHFFESESMLQWLERSYFEANHKRALIDTIAFALLYEKEIPAWARKALIEGYFDNRPKSWDDLFGSPFPKGAKVASLRKLNRIKTKVFLRVKELRAEGRPIGDELFEQVGKEFAVSAQTVRNAIYYDKGLQFVDALLEWATERRDDGVITLRDQKNEERANKLFWTSIKSKKRP